MDKERLQQKLARANQNGVQGSSRSESGEVIECAADPRSFRTLNIVRAVTSAFRVFGNILDAQL
jgi:hypothetical protein